MIYHILAGSVYGTLFFYRAFVDISAFGEGTVKLLAQRVEARNTPEGFGLAKQSQSKARSLI